MDRNHDNAAVREDADTVVPLRLAVPGQPWSVVRVDRGAGHAEDAERLKQMGLCEGRQVQLIQPGDPLIVRLYGSRMALSARLAALVHVAPLPCCRNADPASRACSEPARG